jgi:hypothetical protein
MFNSMRLEEADEAPQAAQPRNIQTAMADLDPVIPYGSFGQVAHLQHSDTRQVLLHACILSRWHCQAVDQTSNAIA